MTTERITGLNVNPGISARILGVRACYNLEALTKTLGKLQELTASQRDRGRTALSPSIACGGCALKLAENSEYTWRCTVNATISGWKQLHSLEASDVSKATPGFAETFSSKQNQDVI